jgi:hypothetical protein
LQTESRERAWRTEQCQERQRHFDFQGSFAGRAKQPLAEGRNPFGICEIGIEDSNCSSKGDPGKNKTDGQTMSIFRTIFPGKHTFLAVVHVESKPQTLRNAQIAKQGGADGVFLINHFGPYNDLLECYHVVRE